MNIFQTAFRRALLPALALPLLALGLAACDIDSVDSTTANLADNEGNFYNYSGMYMSASNTSGSTTGYSGLVFPAGRQSGATLTWMRLLQYGSVIEAYDNAGLTWSGNVSAQNGEVASFQLSGRTTAGLSVQIAGTLSYASQLSTMDATWIEPGFSGSIFAQATVSPVVTNSAMSISPRSATLDTTNETENFTVTGGSGTYTWSVASANGSVSPTEGSSTKYTCLVVGENTITVKDSNGNIATANITGTASTNAAALSISPKKLQLNTSSVLTVPFKVAGGIGPYTWAVSNTNLGSIVATTVEATTANYTSTKTAGVNTITVTDLSGKQATATAEYK